MAAYVRAAAGTHEHPRVVRVRERLTLALSMSIIWPVGMHGAAHLVYCVSLLISSLKLEQRQQLALLY